MWIFNTRVSLHGNNLRHESDELHVNITIITYIMSSSSRLTNPPRVQWSKVWATPSPWVSWNFVVSSQCRIRSNLPPVQLPCVDILLKWCPTGRSATRCVNPKSLLLRPPWEGSRNFGLPLGSSEDASRRQSKDIQKTNHVNRPLLFGEI